MRRKLTEEEAEKKLIQNVRSFFELAEKAGNIFDANWPKRYTEDKNVQKAISLLQTLSCVASAPWDFENEIKVDLENYALDFEGAIQGLLRIAYLVGYDKDSDYSQSQYGD